MEALEERGNSEELLAYKEELNNQTEETVIKHYMHSLGHYIESTKVEELFGI